MKMTWIFVVVLGVIIVILLGILFFYNPAKAPTTVPAGTGSATSAQSY